MCTRAQIVAYVDGAKQPIWVRDFTTTQIPQNETQWVVKVRCMGGGVTREFSESNFLNPDSNSGNVIIDLVKTNLLMLNITSS